jgi:hypothetical protein
LKNTRSIAILGGGPSGLFLFKRIVDAGRADLAIDIFEKNKQLGAGFPYSTDGANDEHITNVSGNEIPKLVTSVAEWINTIPQSLLDRFHMCRERYNDFKVLPRLLFGLYLSAQFDLLREKAERAGILTRVHFQILVTDIIDQPDREKVVVEIAGGEHFEFDQVIICTGHRWPVKYEGTIPGYYDSPYPPSKLAIRLDHPVAIKGASLTAIDAIRTLARHNGKFSKDKDGKLFYKPAIDSADFRLVMHSRNGLLPAIRFHLADPHLSKEGTLTVEEITRNRNDNNGFLPLDFIFEKDFKDMFRVKDPEFYDKVRNMSMEEFVASMIDLRENIEPFHLFRAEYREAEKSIKRKESVYWKEMLAILSFAMNYPAKYLSAEDMQRLQKVLMPLISIVIAFVPQSSCEELLALHEAGVLDIVAVGDDSYVEPLDAGGAIYHYTDNAHESGSSYFKTFVDCVGQPHLSYKDVPYKSLLSGQTISPALLKFRETAKALEALEKGNKEVERDSQGQYFLKVPGIAINNSFQVIDPYGAFNDRIYMMAVPYIGGYNPDYSGLDFCEAASSSIIKSMFEIE